MIRFIKDWTLPIAMGAGMLFYSVLERLSFLTPYLIFFMLLITFCKLSFRNMKITRLHGWLLLIQLAGGLIVYALFARSAPTVAQGMLICILAPTATSAAVITGMLGGNMAFLTTYTLLSSLEVAVAAPVVFSLLGVNGEISFTGSFVYIGRQVAPLLLGPLALAWIIQRFAPRLHAGILRNQVAGFYLWGISLMIVMAKTTHFFFAQPRHDYKTEIALAGSALLICLAQFLLGRRLGKNAGDPISAQQGLGQKNTILAIWMAQSYLTPIASIAPSAYVVWQNIINSWQLWEKRKKETKRQL